MVSRTYDAWLEWSPDLLLHEPVGEKNVSRKEREDALAPVESREERMALDLLAPRCRVGSCSCSWVMTLCASEGMSDGKSSGSDRMRWYITFSFSS